MVQSAYTRSFQHCVAVIQLLPIPYVRFVNIPVSHATALNGNNIPSDERQPIRATLQLALRNNWKHSDS